MFRWNSIQYEKFIRERTQPAIDLANRIQIQNPKNAIDIGCGPGNSTNILHEKFVNARITGVDNSQEMINRAKVNYPDLDFLFFDATKDFGKLGTKYDIVFSNACIQWIPNHRMLIENMSNILNDDGVLAIQTPMNYQEPIHLIIEELIASRKWKAKFPDPRIFYNLTPEEYFDLLSKTFSDFTTWETIYHHRMPSHESIVEWYKGTGLWPYLSVLDEIDALAFEQEVFNEVVKAYPKQENGEIIFRFPRFFFTAVK